MMWLKSGHSYSTHVNEGSVVVDDTSTKFISLVDRRYRWLVHYMYLVYLTVFLTRPSDEEGDWDGKLEG